MERLVFNVCRNTQFFTFYFNYIDIYIRLNSPLNKATRDTCDLHNHSFLEQPSRQNLDRKFWKLERVAYLAMETDETMFADQLETWTIHWAFDHRMCQGSKGRGAFDDCLGEVSSWTGNVSGREECKGKKKWLCRRIACSARTSKGTDYIRTAFLKVWCYHVSDVSEWDRVLYFCSSIAD